MSQQTLSLTLTKRQSILDGLTMMEKVPIERIRALLKSDLLCLIWDDDDDPHKKMLAENYANEKAQMSSYLKQYNNIGVQVKYKKPKHQWGRSFPIKALGLSCMRRPVRNALIKDLYYDCDLKNAQPQIIRNLCESNSIPCPVIKRYCENRDDVLKEVQSHYEVDRDIAKDLFIRLCFFGSFFGWCKKNKITNDKPLEFITLFERELKDIADRIKKVNPTLYETARKKKEDSGITGDNKVLGSFFALFSQEYESRIVESVLCYLINNTDLMKIDGTKLPVGSYEYDGIKILKENVDRFEDGIVGVLQLLNDKTFELTGFKLEWSAKSLDDGFDLDEWISQVIDDDTPISELVEDTQKILKAIRDSDCGIIETIMELKPDNFIYSVDKDDGSKGDWYGWNGTRWEKSDAPLRKAIMYEVPKYWTGLLDKWTKIYEGSLDEDEEPNCNYKLWKETKDKMESRIFMLKSSVGINGCVSVAKTLMANYDLEFDTKEDLFGCENGVIDIANECFRPYRFDDFITFSCGYDFTPKVIGMNVEYLDTEEEKEMEEGKEPKTKCRQVTVDDLDSDFNVSFDYVMDIFKKIFPDDSLRDYFFKIASTGMSGRAIEKFFVFNGNGRNGKGVANEFLEKVFGSYFARVNPIVFSENQKTKNSASANPEIAGLNKKRYVVAKEPQKDAPLHNNIIKDFTGGGSLKARNNYSNKTEVKLCLTLVMECNVKPPYKEAPKDADVERINDILFQSKFCNDESEWDITTGEQNHIYPLDAGLKETLKNSVQHRNTMLNILLYNLFAVKNVNYDVDAFRPESVKQRSLAYLQDSYDIHNIFKSLFELRNEEHKDKYVNFKGEPKDEDWTVSKIAGAIRKSADFFELPKSKQKEYKAEAIEDFFRNNNFYRSAFYIDRHSHSTKLRDYRLKIVEEEEE